MKQPSLKGRAGNSVKPQNFRSENEFLMTLPHYFQ